MVYMQEKVGGGVINLEKAIENEMRAYAEELQSELTEKYTKEFLEKMNAHRNQVVLDIVSRIRIEKCNDPEGLTINLLIKM